MSIQQLQADLQRRMQKTMRISDIELANRSGVSTSGVSTSGVVNILYGNIATCSFDSIVAISTVLGLNAHDYLGSEREDDLLEDILPLHFQEIELIRNLRTIDAYGVDCIREIVTQLASAQFANKYFDGPTNVGQHEESRLKVVDFKPEQKD